MHRTMLAAVFSTDNNMDDLNGPASVVTAPSIQSVDDSELSQGGKSIPGDQQPNRTGVYTYTQLHYESCTVLVMCLMGRNDAYCWGTTISG